MATLLGLARVRARHNATHSEAPRMDALCRYAPMHLVSCTSSSLLLDSVDALSVGAVMQNKRRATVRRSHWLAVAVLLVLSSLFSPTPAFAAQSTPKEAAAERLIAVYGNAFCRPKFAVWEDPAPCRAVQLMTESYSGYNQTIAPSAYPADRGKFRFEGVPIGSQTDLTQAKYTLVTEATEGVFSEKAVRCFHNFTLQGAFVSGADMGIEWGHGPWSWFDPAMSL